MPDSELLGTLRNITAEDSDRAIKAKRIVDAIRKEGSWRWVGIYDVDFQRGLVVNIAWSGYSAPSHQAFPITQGLTSRAIAGRRTINAGNVADDSGYMTTFDSTRAEIIVPILGHGERVIGTLDVESEHLNAFDVEAQALLEESARVLEEFWAKGE
ncbi:GAF domain-containing protein [Tunturiibacter gelidoferens]|uniref:GAF domain-containing protein n=1 Tax=Tunturiibacter gelidiferens TaxID=3069689 RepID=A0A9X0QDL6_9BACT|nr:GAF domain-containing protein [Edaphobacter lichenicola]MBB5328379.1 GAF domain-containing protein [Edaphobacter lichenicola]